MRGAIDPRLGIEQLFPIRGDVLPHAFGRPLQRDGSEEEHREDEVREQRREPDNLPRGVKAFPDDAVHDDPAQQEGAEEFPLHAAQFVDAAGDVQDPPVPILFHGGLAVVAVVHGVAAVVRAVVTEIRVPVVVAGSPGQAGEGREAHEEVEERPGDDDAVVHVEEENQGHGGVSAPFQQGHEIARHSGPAGP